MFDTFGYAIAAYQNVRMYDPTGPLADDSLMASAVAYFRHGQFEDAAADFDLLRKEYPNSEHQKAAHILGLQAKMRVYQGKYYDPTALNEAGEIADQTLAQFGDQLGPEQDSRGQGAKANSRRKGQPRLRHGRILRKTQVLRLGTALLSRSDRKVSYHRSEPRTPGKGWTPSRASPTCRPTTSNG